MIESINSRRNFRTFYLTLFLISLFFFLMGFATLGLFIHLYNSNEFEARNYGLVPLFALIILAFLYILYRYIKISPSIHVFKYYIVFNNSSIFYWKDIEKIKLTGKRRFIFLVDREGVMLKFKDQKERIFLDSLYANAAQIKMFIQCVVIDKASYIDAKIIEPEIKEIANEQFVLYKGIQFFNFRGIMLWMIIGLLLWGSILKIQHWGFLIFFIVLGFITMLGLSWFMYYFELSDDYILIRNHNLFWVKKLYRLSDIKEIVFEQQDRMPNCLRVITNDFESKLYPAATLRNKKWMQLKEDLEKANIKVRNEFILYEPFEFKLFN